MKRTSLLALFVLFALPSVALAQAPAAQNESDEQAVARLEKEFNDAQLRDDIAVLDRMLADDFVISNLNDTTNTKAQYIDDLKAAGFGWLTIKDEDVKIRLFGDSAIVTLLSTRRHEFLDNDLRIRYTRVYAKRQGRWQIVSIHAQALPQPQPAQPAKSL